jgi:hypothetical protein
VRQEDAWRASDAVRLVFHVFKLLKSREVDIVEATVRELGIDNVRFAFIHVVDDHPFMMFDAANPGAPVRDAKGSVTPRAVSAWVMAWDQLSWNHRWVAEWS